MDTRQHPDMKRMLFISVSIATVLVSGCSTPSIEPSTPIMQAAPVLPKTDLSALAGVWHGREVTPGREGPVSLSISGQTLEFHGHDENDWVKGTFTLQEDTSPKRMIGTITDCPSADYAGKKSWSIYRIEDGTLTISGNAPGVSDFPSAFDAPGARQFVFKHD